MTHLIHIADRVLNTPLLITREKAEVILSVLAGRIGINTPEASRFEGSPFGVDQDGRSTLKPYRVSNGVGIITITGSLVARGAWVGASSGLTSYEGIQHQLKTAVADPDVHSVLLDIHSPGGEVVGCFETAAMVRALSDQKKTIAVVNGLAASAAYGIASGATEIVTTGSGISGSIGVVWLHADFSKQLEDDGIKPTWIFAGEHKVDGNPLEPLSDDVRADIQAEIDAIYSDFLTTVENGRGDRMTADAARATQARTMIGENAVAAGLADRLGTFEDVLDDLQKTSNARSGRQPVQQGRFSMDKTTGTPGANAETGNEDAIYTQAQYDDAVSKAIAQGKTLGAATEKERISGVLTYLGRGHDSKVLEMAADGTSKKADAAMAILDADAGKSAEVQAALEKLDKAAEGVTSSPSALGDGGTAGQSFEQTPEGWAAEWDASDKLQAEYITRDGYVAMKKREARKAA